MFGPLCLPFHFTKTRRSLGGLGLGVTWMIGAFVVMSVIEAALGYVLGVE